MSARSIPFMLSTLFNVYSMHADNGSTVQIVLAVTVIPVFVLVGMLLVLGLIVYTIKTKRKKNRRYNNIIIILISTLQQHNLIDNECTGVQNPHRYTHA